MDGLRWSQVLLQWVRHSELISDQFDSIEQCNVQEFYQRFRSRMESTLIIKEENIIDFLKKHFPHYELYLTESDQIAAPDHFYIFSLLLYFSCVRHPDTFFQHICSGFDKLRQVAVGAFLKSMLDNSQQRKEVDRMMIQRAIQDAMPQTMLPPASSVSLDPPLPSMSQASSQLSVPSRITSADLLDSPLRLSNRVPKLSPPTPKTIILDERTRQLKELKAQLEAERYEKGYLEMQLKQLQDKNDRFMDDKRKQLKEIRELKSELQSCNRENESPNKQRDADHKLNRIQRQLNEKEENLDRLKIELETISENNRHATEMINYRNCQISKLNNKILELEGSIVTLNECILEKEEIIKYLRENNEDLENFIKENRLKREAAAADNLNTSFECMELSSAGNSTGTSGGTGTSPENMACAVIDVQLKEKVAENALLKRSLESYEQEKVRVSGLVGQFFRLYGDIVGSFPNSIEKPNDVGFVEKMNIFKICYETLFEEYGKAKVGKELLEEKNDVLEINVSQMKAEVNAKEEVLRELEIHSAQIERDLAAVRKTAVDYQRQNEDLNEKLLKQKRDFLKLISEKDNLHQDCDKLSKQNLNLNVELNSVKEEYDSITKKIDYLMILLNEDYEGSDYSSWFDKMDDMRERLRTLKEDKDKLTALNMKLTVEKIALQKEISIGESRQQSFQNQQIDAEKKVQILTEELKQIQTNLDERNEKICFIEKEKTELQQTIQTIKEDLLNSQSSLNVTRKQLETTQLSLESVQSKMNLIQEELLTARDNNCTLRVDLENQQKLTEKFETQSKNILLEKNELESKLELFEKDLLTKTQKLEEVSRQEDYLTQENTQLIERVSQLLAEKTSLERTVVQQQNISQKNIEEIEHFASKIHELEQLLSIKTSEIEQQERNWNDRQEQTQKQLSDARKQQDLLNLANRSLLSGFDLVQSRILQLESLYSSKVTTLQKKMGQISDLLTKLSAYQYKVRLEKSSLEENLAQIVTEFEALQLENEQLETDKTALQKLLADSHVEKQTAMERNVELEDEVSEMNVRLNLERTNVKELRDQLEVLVIEKTKAIDEGTKVEADLRKHLHDAENLSKKLDSDVQRVEGLLTDLNRQLLEKVDQLRVLSNEHDEYEIRYTQLEVELNETQSNLKDQKKLSAQQLLEKQDLEDQLHALQSEKTQLESDLSESLGQLEEKSETISRLCREKERLEEKVEELATVLGAVREGKASLHEALEQEREKSDELGCQLTDVSEELAKLQNERQELLFSQEMLLNERNDLVEKMDELTESIALLEEDRDTLREEKCRLEAEVERIDTEREALSEQSGKLLTEISNVREQLKCENSQQEARFKQLTTDSVALEEKLKLCTEELRVSSLRVQELEKTCKTMEVSLADKEVLENKVAELSQNVTRLNSEKSSLGMELTTVQKQLKSHQDTIDQLNSNSLKITEANNQLLEQNELIEMAKKELEVKVCSLTESHKNALEQITSLEIETETLSNEISARETILAEKKDLLKALQRKQNETNESLKTKTNEVASIAEQLAQMTTQLNTVKQTKEDEILQQTSTLAAVTENHQQVVQKLEQAEREKLSLESQLEKLSDELKMFSTQTLNKQQEIETKESEILTLNEALAASEAKYAELRQNIEVMASAKQALEKRLQSTETELVNKQEYLLGEEKKSLELAERLSEAIAAQGSERKQLEELQKIRLSLESELKQLNAQLTETRAANTNHQKLIATKETEIIQLTEGLKEVKQFQLQLESKVADYETAVADKDQLDSQLIQLQNKLELVQDGKRKIADDLEILREEKSDTETRLIQQLQDYDTLNEAFLNERELNKELDQKQQELARKLVAFTDECNRLQLTLEEAKSQIDLKDKLMAEKDKQMECLKNEIDRLFGTNQQIDTLTHELMTLKVANTELQTKKDELQDTVEYKQTQEKGLHESMEQLRVSLKSKQQEIDSLHSDLASLKDNLHILKIENSKMESAQELQKTMMLNLELKNSEQCKKIEKLEESLSRTETSHLEDNSKVSVLLKELEKYKHYGRKIKELEELHLKERDINVKCQRDSDILAAKLAKHREISERKEQQWKQEKESMLEKLNKTEKSADERVKDVRIELEGKLEKMKEKMRTLYNEEMQKLKTKHEKDFLDLKDELQLESKKFKKLEIHASKCQQQIKELIKENEFVKSKLRIMEGIHEERKSMLPPPPVPSQMSSNLKMEDEEGEVFNNTYLTDLKTGRMSPMSTGRESIRYSELMHRNSMVPPHLKSSYLAQYTDGEFTDDDNRDTASGALDDSSTSLISRKKVDGQTTYKRPGPPTPSKKGGRLSFGGSLPTNDFQYKEILKDSSNNGSIGSRLSLGGRKSNVGAAGGSSVELAELNARRKTPGKFKQMFNATSLLNQLGKDENSVPRRRLSLFNKK
ncbi:centromere-associated protein E isoform X2 [Malaya genurostris]|uniref:centromere-associated protein E isoform X2 n=1 Tax=Malaya genurostris TaxID=325434 RepID=UPI0026F3DF64|nr:centromere-associated protein E isoform X2 [Malaya genurostris]